MEHTIKHIRNLTDDVENKNVPLSKLNQGDKFVKGGKRFIVLDHHENGTKVIQMDLYNDCFKYDTKSTDFYKSDLGEYLCEVVGEDYKKIFGTNNIVRHDVYLTTVDMQEKDNGVSCCIRTITFDEARQYNNLLVNYNIPTHYWTITPMSTRRRTWGNNLAVVHPCGYISHACYRSNGGVRPVCILKSNILVSKEN